MSITNPTRLTVIDTRGARTDVRSAPPVTPGAVHHRGTDHAETVVSEVHVHVESSTDVVHARRQARAVAAQVGFSASDLTLIATALSEIVRNIVEYAGRGDVVIASVRIGGIAGVRMVARDSGPGIADVSIVMRDGYSTGGHLGIGLPGARRLMDEFDIESVPGRGTTITMAKWLR